MDRKKIKVYRTTEGTIFELICALLIIVMWVVSLHIITRNPQITPADRSSLIVVDVVGTLAIVVCLVCAYFPSQINVPFKLTNATQIFHLIRMTRIEAVLIAILFIVTNLMVAFGNQNSLYQIAFYAVLALSIITLAGYTLYIYKIR